jgi:Dolichyl-phosphate-mannose-protein mannosyltransferase
VTTLTTSGARRASPLSAHAPFAVALAFGVVLRVVVMVAYRPALLFPDSFGYLNRAHDLTLDDMRPLGYSLALKPIVTVTDSLTAISLVQHLLGLVIAVLCYAFLLRRGVPRWAATLAALPVLLDPLQLVLEHYMLSDVVFEALLVGACLALVWRHRPGYVAVALAGLLAASSAIVRGAGTFVLVVFVVTLVCLRLPWGKIAVFLLAAAVPIVPYVTAFHDAYGKYAISTAGPRFLYSRLAPKVHCAGLDLPSYEQKLCPKQPVDRRPDTNYYMWGRHRAAQWHLQPPPGMTSLQVVKDFDKRVLRAEPLTYTKAVMVDLAGGFAPTRTYQVPGYPASYWLFADHYWSMDQWVPDRSTDHRAVLRDASVDQGAADFLVGYRHWIWTPGPLMALLLLLAAAAVAGFGRARRSGDRVAVGLLAGACLLTLATGAAVSGFSWRYQLPQLPLLSTAGVLAITALLRGRRPGTPPEEPRWRPLDRAAQLLVSRTPELRRAAERGVLQTRLAQLVGVVVAVLSAAVAVASGWVAAGPAVLGGIGVGVLAMLLLLGARRRALVDAPPPRPRASADEPADVVLTRR